jgi:hypothetical protein
MQISNATTSTLSPPDPQKAQRAALKELRTATNQVIGSVLLGPMLQSARNTSLKGDYGHGGRGEEVFQAQLDQILLERSGGAADNSLGQVLFDHLAPAATSHARAYGGGAQSMGR